MKNKFWIFITLALVVSACQQEDYFEALDPGTDSYVEDDFRKDKTFIDADWNEHENGNDGKTVLTTYRITGDNIGKHQHTTSS